MKVFVILLFLLVGQVTLAQERLKELVNGRWVTRVTKEKGAKSTVCPSENLNAV
jgi:hypothetical protein